MALGANGSVSSIRSRQWCVGGFRSWVRVAEKWFLGSLASAPHHEERLGAEGQKVWNDGLVLNPEL